MHRTVSLIAGLILCGSWLTAVSQSYQFTVYNATTHPSVFTTSNFKAAAIGKHGHVWIGSANQGLYRFNGQTWQKATILTNHNIRALYMSPVDSSIWVAQSGSGGSNTNGGVNRVADTAYAQTYYGATLGAPTRYAYGIWVDSNNIAWSAHGPHTTGSIVTGGGIGKFVTGSPTGSAIYAGLPSGNYAPDRRCLCIGRGDDEIWVGVDRAVYGGTARSSYIAKYSLDGTFIDSITANNSPIPFNNLLGGVAPRAIHFDKQGRVWVGLSSGGMAVYNNGSWTMVNTGIIPAGAAVNFQAITSDTSGTVYIGTTAGLLVFWGEYFPEDPAFYEFYDANNGLPNSNVGGVVAKNRDLIWVATSGGIVKMVRIPAQSIEGIVKRTKIDYNTGSLIHDPFPLCKVYLFENGVLYDSAITASSGRFVFDTLWILNDYSLIIHSADPRAADLKITCSIPQALVGFQYNSIRLPYDIHVDLKQELLLLPKHTNLLDSNRLPIVCYDTADFGEFERNTRDFIIDNDHPNEEALEGISRLQVQARLLSSHKTHVADMTLIFSEQFNSLLWVLLELAKNKDLTNYGTTVSLTQIAAILLSSTSKLTKDKVKKYISRGCNALVEDPKLRVKSIKMLNAVCDRVYEFASEHASKRNAGQAFDMTVVKKVIGDIVKEIVTPSVFKYYYIGTTESVVTEAMQQVQGPFFTDFNEVGHDNIALNNPGSRYKKAWLDYKADSTFIKVINDITEISSNATNILEFGSDVSRIICVVTGGTGCIAAGAFKLIAGALEKLNIAGTAATVGVSGRFINNMKNSITASTNPIFDSPASGQLVTYSMTSLQNQTLLYNQRLTHVGSLVQSGQRDSVLTSLTSLVSADSLLSASMTDLADIVFSVSPAVYNSNSSFAGYLEQTFVGESMSAVLGRQAVNYLLVSYVIDSIGNYSDSLAALIPRIVQRNNGMLSLYDSVLASVSSYPASQLLFTDMVLPDTCAVTTSYPVTTQIRNIANTAIPGVYALLEVNNGLTCHIDSIYIGSISAGQQASITFLVTTPAWDTTAQIYVDVFSSSGQYDGNGGSVSIRGMAPNPVIQNAQVPAGSSQCFNGSQMVTLAGNNTTFTVEPGGSAYVIAGQKIQFKPGSRVMPGGYLHGYITTGGEYCMPAVPVVRTLPTTTVTDENTVCYDATQVLTVAGSGKTFTVNAGGAATFVAGQKVSLQAGTRVLAGGYLKAAITTSGEYCPSTLPESVTVPPAWVAGGQEVCFDATHTLVVGGSNNTFTVLADGEATLVAGAKISMLPGTKVYTGGHLRGFLTATGDYCGNKEAEAEADWADSTLLAADESRVKIYPNPTSGDFTLEMPGDRDHGPVQAEIYDLRGAQMQIYRFDAGRTFRLSLAGYPAGMYFVRVTTATATVVERVIRQ